MAYLIDSAHLQINGGIAHLKVRSGDIADSITIIHVFGGSGKQSLEGLDGRIGSRRALVVVTGEGAWGSGRVGE